MAKRRNGTKKSGSGSRSGDGGSKRGGGSRSGTKRSKTRSKSGTKHSTIKINAGNLNEKDKMTYDLFYNLSMEQRTQFYKDYSDKNYEAIFAFLGDKGVTYNKEDIKHLYKILVASSTARKVANKKASTSAMRSSF